MVYLSSPEDTFKTKGAAVTPQLYLGLLQGSSKETHQSAGIPCKKSKTPLPDKGVMCQCESHAKHHSAQKPAALNTGIIFCGAPHLQSICKRRQKVWQFWLGCLLTTFKLRINVYMAKDSNCNTPASIAESQNILIWKEPTRIIQVQLLVLHRTIPRITVQMSGASENFFKKRVFFLVLIKYSHYLLNFLDIKEKLENFSNSKALCF